MKSVKRAVLNRMWRKSTHEISDKVATKVYEEVFRNIEIQIWIRTGRSVRIQIGIVMEDTIREPDA
jgi:hypothetical protein